MTGGRRALLLGLVLLGGCASPKAMREEAPPADAQQPGATPPGRERPEEPGPLGADPWGRTPGGPVGPPQPAPAVVRFAEPRDPRPVAPVRRPALPAEAGLAVVAVRDGRLAPEGDLLLGLSAELSQERELDLVVGPGAAPDPPEVDLAGLARLVAAVGRDLLLVEVRPSRQAGGRCDAFLVHAASGALLACWTAGDEPPPAPTGEAADLATRIAAAHVRATAAQ